MAGDAAAKMCGEADFHSITRDTGALGAPTRAPSRSHEKQMNPRQRQPLQAVWSAATQIKKAVEISPPPCLDHPLSWKKGAELPANPKPVFQITGSWDLRMTSTSSYLRRRDSRRGHGRLLRSNHDRAKARCGLPAHVTVADCNAVGSGLPARVKAEVSFWAHCGFPAGARKPAEARCAEFPRAALPCAESQSACPVATAACWSGRWSGWARWFRGSGPRSCWGTVASRDLRFSAVARCW